MRVFSESKFLICTCIHCMCTSVYVVVVHGSHFVWKENTFTLVQHLPRTFHGGFLWCRGESNDTMQSTLENPSPAFGFYLFHTVCTIDYGIPGPTC